MSLTNNLPGQDKIGGYKSTEWQSIFYMLSLEMTEWLDHRLVIPVLLEAKCKREEMLWVGAISRAIDRKSRTCDSPGSFANKITYTVTGNRKRRSRLQKNAVILCFHSLISRFQQKKRQGIGQSWTNQNNCCLMWFFRLQKNVCNSSKYIINQSRFCTLYRYH